MSKWDQVKKQLEQELADVRRARAELRDQEMELRMEEVALQAKMKLLGGGTASAQLESLSDHGVPRGKDPAPTCCRPAHTSVPGGSIHQLATEFGMGPREGSQERCRRWRRVAGIAGVFGGLTTLAGFPPGVTIPTGDGLGINEPPLHWISHASAVPVLAALTLMLIGMLVLRRLLLATVPVAALLGPALHALGADGGEALNVVLAGTGVTWAWWGVDLLQPDASRQVRPAAEAVPWGQH